MNPKYVPSLELCKQLKEAGWNKETEFWWLRLPPLSEFRLLDTEEMREIKEFVGEDADDNDYADGFEFEHYSSPLSDEILEELPCYTRVMIESKGKLGMLYQVSYAYGSSPKQIHYETENNFVNALIKLWLYLKKEGLIK